MLTKLAFKNVGKSLRDYLIYFITLVFGVSIFYMFNSIYAQQELIAITQATQSIMGSLRSILSYVSVFVAVVLGFLIVYANNFFIKRRKKELGIYLTLGMERRYISLILVLETSVMAIIALIVGLLLGVFGSQFMSVFTAKIFETELISFHFVFAPRAALKSIFYFGIIFLVVIIFNIFSISKFKLIDLLHGARKNENFKIKNTNTSILLFIISIACIIASYYLILTNGMANINYYFLACIVLGTIGTMLFFLSLAGILTKIIQSNKNIYLKNLNIFVVRQLTSKINTNFVSISVVCITLLLTIGIFSCGYSMQYVLTSDFKSSTPFNISFFNYLNNEQEDSSSLFEQLPEPVKNNSGITNWAEISKYDGHSASLNTTNDDFDEDYTLDLVKLSEYNTMLKLQGKEEVQLKENEYFILSKTPHFKEIATQLLNENTKLTVGDYLLQPNTNIVPSYINNDLEAFVFVVPDEIVVGMPKLETILNLNCDSTETERALIEDILEYYGDTSSKEPAFDYIRSREAVYQSSVFTKAMVSYLAIYLGIVFMITCAAILAIQQLSEAADNKNRYELLSKLGADKKMMGNALFRQVFSYFFLPLVLAVVHSIIGLTAANDVIKRIGQINTTASIFVTSIFVILVYGTYFTLTYIGSKNIINRG